MYFMQTFTSVSDKGRHDLEARVSAEHTQFQICHNDPKVSEFFIKQNKKPKAGTIVFTSVYTTISFKNIQF
jgi:hypothetical protein